MCSNLDFLISSDGLAIWASGHHVQKVKHTVPYKCFQTAGDGQRPSSSCVAKDEQTQQWMLIGPCADIRWISQLGGPMESCAVTNPALLSLFRFFSGRQLLSSFSASHTPLVCREDTFWIMVERKVTLITPNNGKQYCSFSFHKPRTSGCESVCVCVWKREAAAICFTWF